MRCEGCDRLVREGTASSSREVRFKCRDASMRACAQCDTRVALFLLPQRSRP